VDEIRVVAGMLHALIQFADTSSAQAAKLVCVLILSSFSYMSICFLMCFLFSLLYSIDFICTLNQPLAAT